MRPIRKEKVIKEAETDRKRYQDQQIISSKKLTKLETIKEL